MKFVPHAYQAKAIDFIVDHPNCALFLDMGLGKSVVTLTAIQRLKDDYLEIRKVLVVAPKSVARNTWPTEARKWDHLKDLRISVVMGTAAQRKRALEADADVYVVNRENLVWLVDYCDLTLVRWDFNCVVLDESSSFKNPQARRYKAIRRMRWKIYRLIELTGTPSPNGLMDLWSQIELLDRGQRLGRTLTTYRSTYFTPGRHNGHVVYEWRPKPGAREAITAAISDICLSMKAEDYLDLPDLIPAGTDIVLTVEERKAYDAFEREQLLQVDEAEIEAVTAAALTNKLLQFTGGAVYDSEHDWHEVGRSKLEALAELVEMAGEPVLVFYAYQHELSRIQEELADYAPVVFKGEPDILERWNEGKIQVLLCHPASVAFGLNMQHGGRVIVWYTPTWNLELYQQANARLYRQGQERPVLLYHLVALGTMDERVMAALSGKSNMQEFVMQRIKELKAGASGASSAFGAVLERAKP